MRVHLGKIGPYPLADTMEELARTNSTRHELTDSPSEADLILLCGNFALQPDDLLSHPLFRAHRAKCAVYTADDAYCPLAPGVYASPRRGLSTLLGRVRTYSYASTFGVHSNSEVEDAAETGLPPAPPDGLLFSFVGSSNSALRRRIIRQFASEPDANVRDSSSDYKHFDPDAPGRLEGQRSYMETIKASQFFLCPRGRGTGSFRFFEVMSLGRAPVVLSDAFVLPKGPRWSDFLVRVPERRYRSLPSRLRRIAPSAEERGYRARAEWEQWFSRRVVFDHVVDAAFEARRAGARVAWLYRPLAPVLRGLFRLRLQSTKFAAVLIAWVHPGGSRAATAKRGPSARSASGVRE